jgi:maleylacetoacetate isomerase
MAKDTKISGPEHKLVLYGYWRSSSTYRVRLALAAKGLAYETVAVDLLKGEQSRPEHLGRSPTGYVPCLVVDGEPFVESVAIVELLDELYPEPALFPRDPRARAHVRALVEAVNAGTQPLQNRHVMLHVSENKEAQVAWARHFVVRGLAGLEGLLGQNEERGVRGRFAYGDQMTAADAFLVPQLYNARRFGVDLAPYPRALRVEASVLATEAARRAAPEAQPDAPKNAQ